MMQKDDCQLVRRRARCVAEGVGLASLGSEDDDRMGFHRFSVT